jgi:hypothetical protein
MTPSTFTAREKLKAVERELGFRRRVYASRVADGRMKQADADFQIGIMAAIADDYRLLAAAADQAGRLL